MDLQIHLCPMHARQIWGSGSYEEFACTRSVFLPYYEGFKDKIIHQFLFHKQNSYCIDSAVTEEGKYHVIHMDNLAVLQLNKGVRSKIKEILNKNSFI